MKRLGPWLIMLFGAVLSFSGLASGAVQVGGAGAPANTCIDFLNSGGGVVTTACRFAPLDVKKVVIGTGVIPAGGWTVTVTSANCPEQFPSVNDVGVLTEDGSTVSFDLAVYGDIEGTVLCAYSVVETASTGWTPTLSPGGPYTLEAATPVLVTLTNTGEVPVVTTTTPPTTSVSPTTTIEAPTTTIEEPTTTTELDSGVGAGAQAPVAGLPVTGTRSVGITTVAGLAFIVLGGVMVMTRRRVPTAD
jgi:LPXTG-motif cell wall-anchored protein